MSRSNPYKHKPRHARHTTLIVVEGETDEVFIRHLKSHFGKDSGSRITVRSARGNADAVLKSALDSFEAFDLRIALYDGDCDPSRTLLKRAQQRRIRLLVCSPCLEGLLLAILGERAPGTTADCKRRLGQRVLSPLTNPQTYVRYFPPDLISTCADELDLLRDLLSLFNAPPE
jgi:hypothetical protein